MRLITYTPISTPVMLKLGVDPRAQGYRAVLDALPPDEPGFRVPNRDDESGGRFEKLAVDGYDLRLAVYAPPGTEGVQFHVFQTGVTIAEIDLDVAGIPAPGDLESDAQADARAVIARHGKDLERCVALIEKRLPQSVKASDPPGRRIDTNWTARAVILSERERRDPAIGAFLEGWLEHTVRPEDARRIVSGDIDHSMTWLNYAVVERSDMQLATLTSAMRISQAVWLAQEGLNKHMQETLIDNLSSPRIRKASERLSDARARMNMLQVQFATLRGYMNREKRRVLDDIMGCWEFDALVSSGERMVAIASTKIQEITDERRERSSFATDLILTGIGLLAVIEACLYLVEFSREISTRPALGYEDEEASRILTSIARVDADVMLFSAFALFIALGSFYVFWKTKK